VLLLAALAEEAGSADVHAVSAVTRAVSYAGPRGELRLRDDRHVEQRIYLAQADGLRFDVLAQL
jgi:hypothetical protein